MVVRTPVWAQTLVVTIISVSADGVGLGRGGGILARVLDPEIPSDIVDPVLVFKGRHQG